VRTRAYTDFWIRAAEDTPLFVIALADEHDDDSFFASGHRDTDQILGLLGDDFDIRDRSVLELGCGLGRMTGPLVDRGADVIAVDIAHGMLRDMPARLPQWSERSASLRRVEVPAGALPLASASVDRVFSYIVMHHIPTKPMLAATIDEIGRVLRPGGRAAFQVCNWRPSARARLGAIRRGQLRNPNDPAFRMRFTSSRFLERAVTHADLRIVRQHGFGTPHLWTVAEKPTD
jgi:SAM-dependent methyltransferase